MKKWECIVCGFTYDEEEGWPEEGIEPGTAWDDVPEDWVCPDSVSYTHLTLPTIYSV